jgi:hypothetical protein
VSQITSRVALPVGTRLRFDNLYSYADLALMAQLRKVDVATSSSVPIVLSDGSSFFSESLAKLRLHDSKLKASMIVGNIPQTLTVTTRLIKLSLSQGSNTSLVSPIAVRRTISRSLDQLRDLWRFFLLFALSTSQPRQDVSPVILEFLQALQAVAGRILSLRPRMSCVHKYGLQWAVCAEDCLKMIAASNECLPQSLFTSFTESMLVSVQEIPEIALIVKEQMEPLLQNAESDESWGQSGSSAYQVRNGLVLVLLYPADKPEVSSCRFTSQSRQLTLPFQPHRQTTT